MDTIIEEEKGVLRRIFKLGKRIKGFKFHRATHARLMLLNRQCDILRIKYESWKINKGSTCNNLETLEDKIEFLNSQDISDKLIMNIIKESKKVRCKVIAEVNWDSWPTNVKTKSEEEKERLRINYEFLKSFIVKKNKRGVSKINS